MPEDMIWMPIPALSGYRISNHGDVMDPKGRLLRQHVHNNGLRVRIRKKRYMVRRLVMEAFAGQPLRGRCRIRDLDGDPFNNRYDNLTYSGTGRCVVPIAPRIDHCRMGHRLTGDNVETWGTNNRICVECRDDHHLLLSPPLV